VPRDAVTHVVKLRELVLVDLRAPLEACIKLIFWQRRRCLAVPLKPNANRLCFAAAVPVAFTHAASTQVLVEFTSLQDRVCHCPRIVPPDFFRNATEKLERLCHAFKDGFSPLSRQSNREGSVRIRPHQNQHVDLATTARKVDVNLAEVRFNTLSRIMIQRNERLAFRLPMLLHKATHRVVAALVTPAIASIVAVLIPQPLEDSHRRMTLLRRRRLIPLHNLQNLSLERSQLRG